MYGLKQESTIHQLKSSEIRIGRHSQNNIVLQKSVKISRFHAVITFIDNLPFIKDISKGEWGTYIGDFRIPPDRQVQLKPGDVLGIGASVKDAAYSGCSLELVSIESEGNRDNSNDNVCTQAFDNVSVKTANIETIDITGHPEEPEIIDVDPDPIPGTSPTESVSHSIILLDDEDDVFKKPEPVTNSTVQFEINDVTPKMNGLLRMPEDKFIQRDNQIGNHLNASTGLGSPEVSLIKTENYNDIKNESLNNSQLQYSLLDEIISLDSDEEDFPCSQLNATVLADVPDYSSVFENMYIVKKEIEDESEEKFMCQDPWFEPLSQSIVDLSTETSKEYRRNENRSDPAPTDAVPSKEPREITSPQKQISKKVPKIPIIEAQPHKRRKRTSSEIQANSSKKYKKKERSPDSMCHKLLHKEKKYHHKHRNEQDLKQRRQEKLRELTLKSPTKTHSPKPSKPDLNKVRNSYKSNRGTFLTEELPKPRIKEKKEKNLPPTSVTTGGEITKINGEAKKTPKQLTVDEPGPSAIATLNDDLSKTSPPKPITKKLSKPILKKKKFSYNDSNRIHAQSKKVNFQNRNQVVEIDKLEYDEIVSPCMRYEKSIKEFLNEFETAISIVCSWNPKWLQEQQNQVAPPPLYNPVNSTDLIATYKENLKNLMFHSLWKMIYNAWNVPDNDDLPHTQFVTDSNYLRIEKVNTVKPDKAPPASKFLWTIFATRELISVTTTDLTSGALVILNFYVTKNGHQSRNKTMAFAYVASCNRITADNKIIDRIIFKVYAKPFTIECDLAKMKILTYTKTQLRQFQALAMTAQFPLIKAICSADYSDEFENNLDLNMPLKCKCLDFVQRKAVITCLRNVSRVSSICLIDGISGTGKSQVIVGFLYELFRLIKLEKIQRKFKVLLVTHSDKNSDDLLYRIETYNMKEGRVFRLLRFGCGKKMHPNVNHCKLDAMMEDVLASNKNLIDLTEERLILQAKINSIKLALESRSATEAKKIDLQTRLDTLEKELEDMSQEKSPVLSRLIEHAAKEKVISNVDVVVTTIASCWSSNFESFFIPTSYNRGDIHTFDVCIMDDANLSDEVAMLIPQVLRIPHLILLGDKQIRRYAASPYHRILDKFSISNQNLVINLDTQHRMNLEISEFVKDFYKLKISNKSGVSKKKSFKPFLVVDHDSCDRYGLCNSKDDQMELCDRLLQTILLIDENAKIGIIVSANEQKEIIKTIIDTYSGGRVIVELLDGYSAREHEIVVLCLPNKVYREWLYVAVTRAKYSIFILGDFQQISRTQEIDSMIETSKRKNAFISLRTDPKSISLEQIKKFII